MSAISPHPTMTENTTPKLSATQPCTLMCAVLSRQVVTMKLRARPRNPRRTTRRSRVGLLARTADASRVLAAADRPLPRYLAGARAVANHLCGQQVVKLGMAHH